MREACREKERLKGEEREAVRVEERDCERGKERQRERKIRVVGERIITKSKLLKMFKTHEKVS